MSIPAVLMAVLVLVSVPLAAVWRHRHLRRQGRRREAERLRDRVRDFFTAFGDD